MKFFYLLIFTFISIADIDYGQTTRLSLDDAIKIAQTGNFELIKAQKDVDAARGRFWSSISLPQPKISLSHEFVPIGKNLSFFQEKTLEINQELEFPTNFFLKGSRSNYEIDSFENERDRVAIETTSKVKLLYSKALLKSKMSQLAEDNYKIAKDFYDKAETRRNAGEGTKLESITAKMQFSEAGVTVESAKKEYLAALNELLLVLNKREFSGQNIILTDSIKFNYQNLKLEDLLQEANLNNASYKKSLNQINIASVNKSLAWSGLLPNLSFSYYKQATDETNDFYGFSFGISFPLWFLFEQRGQIEESTANYTIAQEESNSVKNSIELNLKTAYTAFIYEQEQIKVYMSDLIPQSEEVFKLAKLSYDSGEINYVEFLQAKQNLLATRNNYFNSLYSYYTTLSSLEIAVGKLIR